MSTSPARRESSRIYARWVAPISSPPIEDGSLVIEHGRIARVEKRGRTASRAGAIDYGDAVVLPGFVNAHTHLGLTCYRHQVPYCGSFVDWVERLSALMSAPEDNPAERSAAATAEGLARSCAAGVTTVVDTGYGAGAIDAWRRSAINVVGLLEVLGMGPKASADHALSLDRARSALAADSPCQSSAHDQRFIRLGVSPHAPYSTDAAVYRGAAELARDRSLPLATHLAETPDELAFLAKGTGPFRELLERRGLWDGSFAPPGCSPIAYMARLGVLAQRPLLAHVNYASDDDLEELAASGSSVCYCPRAHRFFDHPPHRWRDMLARGINVCVGTDSLASNDTLSVLDELRLLRALDATIGAPEIMRLGTLAGARAVGLDAAIGSLEPGKRADLAVVPLGERGTTNPLEDVLTREETACAAHVGGCRVGPEPAN